MGVEAVLTGMSGSRRDHPIEFIDSRKDVEAIFLPGRLLGGGWSYVVLRVGKDGGGGGQVCAVDA